MTGDDLWAWAGRRESTAIRKDPPAQPAWYRGLLNIIPGKTVRP